MYIFYRFFVATPKKIHDYNPLLDIRQTTQIVAKYCVPALYVDHFGTSKQGILRHVIKACNRKDLTALKAAIQEFNARLRSVPDVHFARRMNCELITQVLDQAYSRTIAPYSHL